MNIIIPSLVAHGTRWSHAWPQNALDRLRKECAAHLPDYRDTGRVEFYSSGIVPVFSRSLASKPAESSVLYAYSSLNLQEIEATIIVVDSFLRRIGFRTGDRPLEISRLTREIPIRGVSRSRHVLVTLRRPAIENKGSLIRIRLA